MDFVYLIAFFTSLCHLCAAQGGAFDYPSEFGLAFNEDSIMDITWTTSFERANLFYSQYDSDADSQAIALNIGVNSWRWQISPLYANLTLPYHLHIVNAHGTTNEQSYGGFWSSGFFILPRNTAGQQLSPTPTTIPTPSQSTVPLSTPTPASSSQTSTPSSLDSYTPTKAASSFMSHAPTHSPSLARASQTPREGQNHVDISSGEKIGLGLGIGLGIPLLFACLVGVFLLLNINKRNAAANSEGMHRQKAPHDVIDDKVYPITASQSFVSSKAELWSDSYSRELAIPDSPHELHGGEDWA